MLLRLILLSLFLNLSFQAPVHAGINDIKCLKILKEIVKRPSIKPLTKTWGVEIELNHGNQYTVDQIAQKLAQFFRDKGFAEVRIRQEDTEFEMDIDYFVEYREKGQIRAWGLPYEPDFNLPMRGSYPGFEITTPIMQGSADHQLLAEVLDYLKKLNINPARDIGGTHTHWGVDQMNYYDLIRIYDAYIKIYDQVELYFAPDAGRNYIDKSELKTTLHKLQKTLFPNMQITDADMMKTAFVDGPIRYNWKHKTMETRFFNSTLESEEILFNVVFSKRFIQKVLEDDSFYHSLDKLTMPEILSHLRLN